MPRNPVNDLKASGALRTKISGTDGPADDFESVTVINPAGVIALVGNQGSARSRIYGDGTKWMPIQSAAPTTLTPGQFFIQTVSGVDNWVFVDSFGVAQYVSGNPGGTDTQVQFNDGGTFGGDSGLTYDKTNDILSVGAAIRLGAGSAAIPAYSITGDTDTGLYSPGSDALGFATSGVLRLTIGTGSIISTVIGLFPATTINAASIRLPHGVTPLLPVDGDMWTTTSGLFAQINGSIIGPFTDGAGTISGTIAAGQVAYGSGTDAINGNAGFVFDVVNSQVALAAGTASLPAYSIIGDLDTGLYGVGANTLGMATSGTLRVSVSTTALTSTLIGVFPASTTAGASIRLPHGTAPTSPIDGDTWTTSSGFFAQINGSTVGPFAAAGGIPDPLLLGNGTVGAPTYSFTARTTDGIYSVAAGSVGVASLGVLTLTVASTAVTSAVQLLGANGTVGAPAYSFTSDPNTGIYRVASDELGMVAGGALIAEFTTGGLVLQPSMQCGSGDGTAALPAFAFYSNSNAGMYRPASSTIGFSTGGTLRLSIDTTVVICTLPIQNDAGNFSIPTYSFSTDTNTGMYRVGVDEIGFAAGGALALSVSSAALTSTYIGIFPATATSNASIRLPHGTAPTSPVNGDLWTTTAGVFARINGGTVGPFGTGGGGVTGSGVANQVAYWTGTSAVGGDAGMTYDATNNQLLIDPATNANPAYSFIGDTNTGIYNPAADTIGFTCSGGLTFSIAAGAIIAAIPITLPDGAAIAPAMTFTNSSNTGFWLYTSNTLVMQANGTEVGEFTSTLARFTLPVQLPATGTASATVLHFNAAGTGIYGDGSSVSFGISAVNALTVVQSGLRAADGSTGAPGYSFLSDNDTGFAHNNGSGSITVVLDGNAYYQFNAASFYAYGQIQVDTSTHNSGTPDYSFAGDTDTGMYRVGADTVGFASAGGLAFSVNGGQNVSAAPMYFPAGTTAKPSIRLPHGVAPTSPTNGDMWTTTSGLYAQINGGTVGPFGTGSNPFDVITIAQAAGTGAPASTLSITPGNHTALTASTEYNSLVLFGASQTFATGAITTQRYAVLAYPTYSFAAASVITQAATLAIVGAPSPGLNATITNSYALWVQSDLTRLDGNLLLGVAGNGLYITEGSNATMGVATLSGGTVVVSTTKVTANSRIFLTRQNNAGTVSVAADVTARTPGTDFTITAGVADTSDVAWLIVEPA